MYVHTYIYTLKVLKSIWNAYMYFPSATVIGYQQLLYLRHWIHFGRVRATAAAWRRPATVSTCGAAPAAHRPNSIVHEAHLDGSRLRWRHRQWLLPPERCSCTDRSRPPGLCCHSECPSSVCRLHRALQRARERERGNEWVWGGGRLIVVMLHVACPQDGIQISTIHANCRRWPWLWFQRDASQSPHTVASVANCVRLFRHN